jgi:hypothetical protein
MSKATPIISRGEPEDRARLASIAEFEGCSGSSVVIQLIRQRYKELFGDLKPQSGEL